MASHREMYEGYARAAKRLVLEHGDPQIEGRAWSIWIASENMAAIQRIVDKANAAYAGP